MGYVTFFDLLNEFAIDHFSFVVAFLGVIGVFQTILAIVVNILVIVALYYGIRVLRAMCRKEMKVGKNKNIEQDDNR